MTRHLIPALLAVGLLGSPAGAQTDPAAALREINAQRTQKLQEIRQSGKQLTIQDVRALEEVSAARAKEALKGVDLAAVDPKRAYDWAQLTLMTKDYAAVARLLEKFLGTNP